MTYRASNGAAIPHLRIGNDRSKLGKERLLLLQYFRCFHLPMGGKRPDQNAVAIQPNALQLRYSRDIDEMPGLRQAHFHQRNETMPAGKKPGVITVSLQEIDRFLD